MNLTERINEDIKNAMKNKESFKLGVIRSIKGGIQLAKIEVKHELTDEEVIDVISKQIKMRKDSIAEFTKAGREDLAKQYQEEIAILNEYMPEQLSKEEVEKIIAEAFNETNPTSMKDMGKIMKIVTLKVKGRFDIGEVSKIIKEKLNNL